MSTTPELKDRVYSEPRSANDGRIGALKFFKINFVTLTLTNPAGERVRVIAIRPARWESRTHYSNGEGTGCPQRSACSHNR